MARPKGSTLKSRYGENKTISESKEIEESITTESNKSDQMSEQNVKIENVSEDIPNDTWNPFEEDVVERDYTAEMIKNKIGDIPESELDAPFPEPVYERPSFSENQNTNPKTDSDSENSTPNSTNDSEHLQSESSGNTTNPQFADLPPNQKRKEAKKTADALIKTWAQVMPYPFVKLASFNMRKLKKLDNNGEIRLSMPVTEHGDTLEEFALETNAQIEDTLRVTEDMQEELHEPLVDVLLEQNLALTPTQRLMFTGISQIVTIGAAGIQLAMQKRDAMESFAEWRRQEMSKGVQAMPNTSPQTQPQPTQETYSTPTDLPDQTETVNNNHTYEAPPTTDDNTYEPPFSMDDYLSGNIKEEEYDNTDVVIEGEPND